MACSSPVLGPDPSCPDLVIKHRRCQLLNTGGTHSCVSSHPCWSTAEVHPRMLSKMAKAVCSRQNAAQWTPWAASSCGAQARSVAGGLLEAAPDEAHEGTTASRPLHACMQTHQLSAVPGSHARLQTTSGPIKSSGKLRRTSSRPALHHLLGQWLPGQGSPTCSACSQIPTGAPRWHSTTAASRSWAWSGAARCHRLVWVHVEMSTHCRA